MRSFVFAAFVTSILVTLAGCATLFSDSTDTITINSEPSGADVYWRGDHIGRTPFTYVFKRQTAASYLEFAKKGYETKKVDLIRTIAGVTWLNIGLLPFSTSGVGTDVSSGKMWQYAPTSYVAHLEREEQAGAAQEIWNEKVMEYVLANEQALKNEISRGNGETLKGLCKLIHETPERCQTFETRAKGIKTLASENGLVFYRSLHGIAIEMREDDK